MALYAPSSNTPAPPNPQHPPPPQADISYWEDALSQELQEANALFVSTSSLKGAQKTNKLLECESKVTRAKNIKKSYKMEMRLIKNGIDRRGFEEKLKKHDVAIGKLLGELKWAKSDGAKSELFGGASRGQNPEGEGDAMLAGASKLQDKTADSLLHTQKMVEATKEVGQATIEELHRQREQIKDITEEVIQIEDNLARADKLIRTFGRRMATDKFIQCFACINVLLLAGVITYAILSKNGVNGKEPSTPSSPVRTLFEILVGVGEI